MVLMQNKLYSRQEVAKQVIAESIKNRWKVIAVTGTSCVGKSTFTGMLFDELQGNATVQLVNADCYLKEEYRAGTKMWKGTEPYLMPKHFDWERLSMDIRQMQEGKNVEKEMYLRGIGWTDKETLYARDVILLEGLFLDSREASEFMQYDLLIKLSSEDEMIRRKRMERDDYYREHFVDFTRTREETLQEAEKTLEAGRAYCVCEEKWNLVKFKIQEDYKVQIL